MALQDGCGRERNTDANGNGSPFDDEHDVPSAHGNLQHAAWALSRIRKKQPDVGFRIVRAQIEAAL
jgi:hypothetical protein